MKITALTSCCVDIYPDLEKIYVGGNSLNFATQCKISGVNDISIIGSIGRDSYGDLIESFLDKYQINKTSVYRSAEPTASNKIYINENGDRFFKADSWNGGAFDTFRLSEADWEVVDSSDIVAMPAGDPNLKELFKRRNQQLVVIDFLDYLPLSFVAETISNIDIAFISAKENMLADIESIASKSGKMIVATLGEKGSIAFLGEQSVSQNAVEAEEIVDTTGCGDAFQAAFAIDWFEFQNLPQALKRGALAAKRVLGFNGGVQ